MHVKVIFVVIGYIEVKEVKFCEKKRIPSCILDESQKKLEERSVKKNPSDRF